MIAAQCVACCRKERIQMTEFEKRLLDLIGYINLRLGEIRDELHELNGYEDEEDEEDRDD